MFITAAVLAAPVVLSSTLDDGPGDVFENVATDDRATPNSVVVIEDFPSANPGGVVIRADGAQLRVFELDGIQSVIDGATGNLAELETIKLPPDVLPIGLHWNAATTTLFIAAADEGLYQVKRNTVIAGFWYDWGQVLQVDESSTRPGYVGRSWCFDIDSDGTSLVAVFAGQDRNELRHYTANVASTPTLVETVSLDAPSGPTADPGLFQAMSVAMRNGRAYVAMREGGLLEVELGNGYPVTQGFWADGGIDRAIRDVVIVDNFLYATTGRATSSQAQTLTQIGLVELDLNSAWNSNVAMMNGQLLEVAGHVANHGKHSFSARIDARSMPDGRIVIALAQRGNRLQQSEGGPYAPWGSFLWDLGPGVSLHAPQLIPASGAQLVLLERPVAGPIQVAGFVRQTDLREAVPSNPTGPLNLVKGANMALDDLEISTWVQGATTNLLFLDERMHTYVASYQPGLAISSLDLPMAPDPLEFDRRSQAVTQIYTSIENPDVYLLSGEGFRDTGLLQRDPSSSTGQFRLKDVAVNATSTPGLVPEDDNDRDPWDDHQWFYGGILEATSWLDTRGASGDVKWEGVEWFFAGSGPSFHGFSVGSAVPSWRIGRMRTAPEAGGTVEGSVQETWDYWFLPYPEDPSVILEPGIDGSTYPLLPGVPLEQAYRYSSKWRRPRGAGYCTSIIGPEVSPGQTRVIFSARQNVRHNIAVLPVEGLQSEVALTEGNDQPIFNAMAGDVRGELLNGTRLTWANAPVLALQYSSAIAPMLNWPDFKFIDNEMNPAATPEDLARQRQFMGAPSWDYEPFPEQNYYWLPQLLTHDEVSSNPSSSNTIAGCQTMGLTLVPSAIETDKGLIEHEFLVAASAYDLREDTSTVDLSGRLTVFDVTGKSWEDFVTESATTTPRGSIAPTFVTHSNDGQGLFFDIESITFDRSAIGDERPYDSYVFVTDTCRGRVLAFDLYKTTPSMGAPAAPELVAEIGVDPNVLDGAYDTPIDIEVFQVEQAGTTNTYLAVCYNRLGVVIYEVVYTPGANEGQRLDLQHYVGTGTTTPYVHATGFQATGISIQGAANEPKRVIVLDHGGASVRTSGPGW